MAAVIDTMTPGAWVTIGLAVLLFGMSVGWHAGVRDERQVRKLGDGR